MKKRKLTKYDPKYYDQFNLFDVKTVERQEILAWICYWLPFGSGPLGEMTRICSFLFQIAEMKGFEPFNEKEITDYKQFARDYLKSLNKIS